MQRMEWEGRQAGAETRLREMLLAAAGGDGAAYRRFLEALGAHLRAYFRKRLSALPDDVEDLVQETLLAVHNQRHTYDPSLPLTAWVHAIAGYKLADLFRRRASREALQEPFGEEHEIFAAADDAPAQARRDLLGLLERLPEKQRRPILCVKLEGLSVVETARLTGMSESAVKVAVHRGLKALAKLIRTPDEN